MPHSRAALLAFLFLALKTPSVLADWDWKAGFGSRSLPFGASGFAELGYGKLLWGAGPGGAGKTDPLYGYVRPYARYQGAGVVNRVDLGVDLNPVSFLNLRTGVRTRYRLRETIATLDCNTAMCDGLLTSRHATATAIVGLGRAFAVASYGWEKISTTDRSQPFGEEASALYGAQGGDSLIQSELTAGASLIGDWSTGLLWHRASMRGQGSSNELKGIFARNKWDRWTGLLGLATYQSSTHASSMAVFVRAAYQGTPSLELN